MPGLKIREMGVLEQWCVIPSKCHSLVGAVPGRVDKTYLGLEGEQKEVDLLHKSSGFGENSWVIKSISPVEWKRKSFRVRGNTEKMWKAPGLPWNDKEHSGTFALRTWWGICCKVQLGTSYIFSKILVQHSDPTRWNIAEKGFELVQLVRRQHITQGVSLYITFVRAIKLSKYFHS